MRIAFPVLENKGLKSKIDSHFGTAKHFLIVDTETNDVEFTDNQKLGEDGVQCKASVFGKKADIDAVITQCMGDGSQRTLAKSNIQIYQAQEELVDQNLTLFDKGELKLFHIFDICQNQKNKKEGGCGHHH